MQRKALISGVVLAGFVAFSTWVVAQKGYWGFVTLGLEEPWGAQILLDLVIGLTLVNAALIRDARTRGINPWPYVIATPFVGSMAPLLYIVVRGLSAKRPAENESDAATARVAA